MGQPRHKTVKCLKMSFFSKKSTKVGKKSQIFRFQFFVWISEPIYFLQLKKIFLSSQDFNKMIWYAFNKRAFKFSPEPTLLITTYFTVEQKPVGLEIQLEN